MIDTLSEHWAVILPLVGAALALFFPQFAPIIKRLTNVKKNPDGTDAPLVAPELDKDDVALRIAFDAAIALIEYYRARGDKEAELAARETAKSLFAAQEPAE